MILIPKHKKQTPTFNMVPSNKTKEPDVSTYYQKSRNDYSPLTQAMKEHRMDKWDKTSINRVNTLIIDVVLYMKNIVEYFSFFLLLTFYRIKSKKIKKISKK